MPGPARTLSFALIGLVGLGGSTSAKDWRITINSTGHVRPGTPVVVAAPDGVDDGAYKLASESSATSTPAFVSTEGAKRTLTAVLPELSGKSTFILKKDGASFSPDRGVAFVPRGKNLEITIDGKPFSVYRVDVGAKPFLFPLIGPTGDPYTRAYPMETVAGEDQDHPHQRSFWFTHGKVNGVDFWSEMKNHGTIKGTSRSISTASPVSGRLATRDDWFGPDGKKVCEDERVLTIYNSGSIRVLDFAVKLKATEGPVVMGDTKEGMFGLRVASSMDVDKKKGGKIRNAEGLEDDKAWGKASPWVDYTGPVDGETVGVAILNHPRSFRYPTTWHVRTYGLFAANPFGWHDFGMSKEGDHTIPKGESLWFEYRVILHAGDGASAEIADHFAAFATPPAVEWAILD
jgi:hypothetical protein